MFLRKKTWLIVFGTVSAVLILTIFCLSAQPAEESAELSGGVLAWLTGVLGAFCRTPEQKAALFEILKESIRKLAHFTEYTLLGFFLTLFSAGLHNTVPRALPLPFLIGVPYAGSDEWHQRFVEGRSCELRDMLIDSAGIAFGTALASLCLLLYQRRRKKKEQN